MRGFAEHQPMTPVIETLRGLWMGTPLENQPLWALVWSVGILAVSAVLGPRIGAVQPSDEPLRLSRPAPR